MDADYLGEYSERGALLELKDVDLSKFDQPVADSGKVDGKQYGVTSGVDAMVVLANPALVSVSGVTLPDDETWTWDDLNETAAAITAASPDGVYGTGQVNSDAAANLWFRQHGSRCSRRTASWDSTRLHWPSGMSTRPGCAAPRPSPRRR